MPALAVEIEPNPRKTSQAVRELVNEHENKGGLFGALLESQEIGDATLHVSALRLDGQVGFGVRNTGRAPMVRSKLSKWRTDFEGRTLHDSTKSIGVIRGGSLAMVRQEWQVAGPLDVLFALARILFTGTAKVQQHVVLEALGYKKEWRAEIVVPVRGVQVRWD